MIRTVFFILMACGLAGFGAVAWIATRPPSTHAATPPPPVKQTVLVAARAVTAGSLLKPEDLVSKQVAADSIKAEGIILDTQEVRRDLVGAMARRALVAGDLLRNSDLIRPGDHGFLAAALKPGMRAVTITADTSTGSAALISPGDHVDLILTQSIAEPNVPAGRRIAAETVLSDVRVLAVDQQLVLGAATSPPSNQKDRTVTIEVTEDEAQRVSVATRLGHLSLSVRSVDGAQQMQAPRADGDTVWAMDVSPALGAAGSTLPTTGTVRVFQGAGDVKEFKF